LQRLLLRFRQELDLTPALCRGFFVPASLDVWLKGGYLAAGSD
jgi:hypothetical protein